AAQPMRVAFKDCVALTVTNQSRFRPGDRKRRRAPDLAGLLVTQIDDLAGRIANRVVAPRSQAVELAVKRPGKSCPALGHHKPETRVGHDVDPRRWGKPRPERSRAPARWIAVVSRGR